MKKLIAMLLVICMVLGLAACSDPGTTDPTGDTGTDGTQEIVGGTEDTGSSSDDDEFQLPLEDGYNQVTFYWDYKGDPETADFWIWHGDVAGKGYAVYPCAYGVKCVINVPDTVSEIGFIPRYNCSDPCGTEWGTATKDYEGDRFVVITERETVVYLVSGDPTQYYSKDGGKTLLIKHDIGIVAMTSFTTLQYSITPRTKIESLDQIKVYADGEQMEIAQLSSLGKNVSNGIITLTERLDPSKKYTVVIEDYGEEVVIPTTIFDSEEFIKNYVYDGDDLGAVIHGTSTTFKVWAPTASEVVLNLFTAGNDCEAYSNVLMTLGEKGVWEATVENCGHGIYYTYSVTTALGTQEAVDPYAQACGVNGNRGMVVDLDSTDPAGWGNDKYVNLDKYTDAVIWEVHVRDFSNKVTSSAYPGKYLAFTETGLKNNAGIGIGVDYLTNLGITHVHLQPTYDYASVDETTCDDFNWGYDPKNYNCVEGSYSTDPYHGEVRINEYKQMVQAMHNAGLGVVVDVVYNHTYDANSNLNKVVPYYYYRYTSTGANSSASGCGNDTASERYMFRKYMIDSVTYWAKEYNVDGFRFDLMGLHDLKTMQLIEQALHAINPDAIIYGEAWTMGSTIDGSAQGNQSQIHKITTTPGAAGGIAVFSAALRDALKGSVFDKVPHGYINGNFAPNTNNIRFGLSGGSIAGPGWTVNNACVINYMSCHDNMTLWDILLASCEGETVEQMMARNRLGIGIVMTSHGTPFFLAGEEMMRSKDGDHNSYNSSDEINNIDWEVLTETSNEYQMMLYYKGLIEMRKEYEIFRANSGVSVSFSSLPGGGIVAKYEGNGSQAVVLINPNGFEDSYTLDGEWKLVANGTQAGADVISTASGAVTVDACSIMVFVK